MPMTETMAMTSAPLPTPPAGTPVSYSPALFPTPLLMPVSQLSTFPQAVKEPPPQKQGERDELLEAGAILALLKLVFS